MSVGFSPPSVSVLGGYGGRAEVLSDLEAGAMIVTTNLASLGQPQLQVIAGFLALCSLPGPIDPLSTSFHSSFLLLCQAEDFPSHTQCWKLPFTTKSLQSCILVRVMFGKVLCKCPHRLFELQ